MIIKRAHMASVRRKVGGVNSVFRHELGGIPNTYQMVFQGNEIRWLELQTR